MDRLVSTRATRITFSINGLNITVLTDTVNRFTQLFLLFKLEAGEICWRVRKLRPETRYQVFHPDTLKPYSDAGADMGEGQTHYGNASIEFHN